MADTLSHIQATNPAPSAPNKAQDNKQADTSPDVYNVLFFLLLEAMSTRQATVFVQAKELSNNAKAQDNANHLNSELTFKQIPDGADQNKIDQIEAENRAIAAERSNVQNTLITLRQKSQVLMTETNTNVNYLQQYGAMDTGWLKTLQAIFQVINKMNPGAGG